MTHEPGILTAHLTEEELDDLLLGQAAPHAQQHLDACELCRAQLAPFQTAVAAFNDASMAWAQAKSNTISRDLSTIRPARTQPLAWSLGAAMLVAVAVALSVGVHRTPSEAGTTAQSAQIQHAAQHAPHDPEEIAADNAMLEAINSAINPAEPSPIEPFDHAPTRSTSGRHTPLSEVSD